MADRDRLQNEHRSNFMDGHTGDVYFDEVSHHEHHDHPAYPSGKLLRPNLDFMHQDFPRGLHSVTESAMDTQPQRDDYFAPRQPFRQPLEMRSTFSLSVIKDIRPNPMDIFTPSASSSPGPAVELDNDYTNLNAYQEKDSDLNLGYTRASMYESEECSFEVIEDDNALSDQERENFLVPAASSGLLRDEDTGQDLAGRLSKSLGSLRAYEEMSMDESNIEQFMTNLNVPDYNANQRQGSTMNFFYTSTKSTAGLSEAMTITSSFKQERSSDTSAETSDRFSYFTPSTFPRQQFDSVADQNWDQIDKALHMLADFRGLSSTDEDTSTLTDITSEQSSEYVDRSVKERDDNNNEIKAGDTADHVANTEDDDDTVSRNTEETYLGPSEVSYFIGSLHDDSVTSDGEDSYVDDAQIERLENVVQQYRDKVRDLEAQSEQRSASPPSDRQLRYSPLLPNRYYNADDNSVENDLSLPSNEPTYRDARDYREDSSQELTERNSHEREASPNNFSKNYTFDDDRQAATERFEYDRDQFDNKTYDRTDRYEHRDYTDQNPREDSRQRNLFHNYVEEYQPTNDYVDHPMDNFQNRPPSNETYDKSEHSSYERNNIAEFQNDKFVSNIEDNFHVADMEKETFVRDHAVPQATRTYEPNELTPSMDKSLQYTTETPSASEHFQQDENSVDSALENDKQEMQTDQSVNEHVDADPSVWDYEELRFLSAPMLDYYDETALMDYGYSAERRHESFPSDREDRMLTTLATPPRQETQVNSERDSDTRNDLYSDSLEDTSNTFNGQDKLLYNEDSDLSNDSVRSENVDNGGLDRTKRTVEDAYQLLQTANQEAGFQTDNSVPRDEHTQDKNFEKRTGNDHRFDIQPTEADERNLSGSFPDRNEEYSVKDSLDSENLQQFNETLQRVYENDQPISNSQQISYQPFREGDGTNQPTYDGNRQGEYTDGNSFGFSGQSDFNSRNDEEQFAQRQTENFRDEDSMSGNWERKEADGYREGERYESRDYYEEPRRAESPYFEDIDDEEVYRSERLEVADDLSFGTRQTENDDDVSTRDVPAEGYERAELPTYEEPLEKSEDVSNVQMEDRGENRTANEPRKEESVISSDTAETEVPHLNEHQDAFRLDETDNGSSDGTKQAQREQPEEIRGTMQANDFGENYADPRAESPFREGGDSGPTEFADRPNSEMNNAQSNEEQAGNEHNEKFDLSNFRNYDLDKNNESELVERNMEYHGNNERQAYEYRIDNLPTEQRQRNWSNNQSMSNSRFDDERSNTRDFDMRQEYSENTRQYYSSRNERVYNESPSKENEPDQQERTESPLNEGMDSQQMTFTSSRPSQNLDLDFDEPSERSPSDNQNGRDLFNEEQYSNEESRTERNEDASNETSQEVSRTENTEDESKGQLEDSEISEEASLGVSEVQYHVGCSLDESIREENGADEISKDEIDTNAGYISALSSFMENPSGALDDVEGHEQKEADSNSDKSNDLQVQLEEAEYAKENDTNNLDEHTESAPGRNTVAQDGNNSPDRDIQEQVYKNKERQNQLDDYQDRSKPYIEDRLDYSNEPFYANRQGQFEHIDRDRFSEGPQQYFDRTNENYSQDNRYGQREEYSDNAPFDNYNEGNVDRFQESSRNYDRNQSFSYQEPQEATYDRYPERNNYDEMEQSYQLNNRNADRDLSYEQQNYRQSFSPSLESGEQFQRNQMYQAEPRESNYGVADSNAEQTNEKLASDEPELITENLISSYDDSNDLTEISKMDRPEGTSTVESAELFTRDQAFNKPEGQDVRQPSFIYIGSEPDSQAGDEGDETPNEEDDDDEEYFNRIEPYYVVEDVDYQLGDLVVPSIEPPESVLMDDRRTQWNLAEHVNLSDLQDHYIAKAGSTDILHSALDRLFTQQSLRDVTTGQYASSLAHATDMMDSELDSESVSPASRGKVRGMEEDLAELSDGSASLTSGDTNSAQLRRRTLKPSGQRSWYQLDNLPVNTDKLGGSNRPSQIALPMDSITLSVHSVKIPSQSTGGYGTERTVATSITTSMAPPTIAALVAMIPAPPAQISRSAESSGFEAPEIPAETSPSEAPVVTPRQATRSAPPIPSARASRHIITRPHGDLPALPATKSAALASQAEIHQAGDHRTVSQVWHFDRGIIEPYKNVLDIRPDEGTEPTAVLFYPCLLPDRSLDTYDRIMDHLHKFVMSRLEEIEDKPFRIFVFNAAVPTGTEHAVTWIQHVHKSMDPAMKENMQSLLIVHPNLKTKTELKTIGRAVLGKEFYNKIHFVKSLKDLSRMQSVQYAAIPKPVRDHDRRREWKLTKNTCGC